MHSRPFNLDLLPVALAFDSARGEARRGVRRGRDQHRHLLFEAEDLCVDLLVDDEPDHGSVSVHGQIADRRDPLKGLGGTPVVLMDAERVVGWMFGNHNGEFAFEVWPGSGWRLCLPIAERGRIEIALDSLLPARPAMGERGAES
jgi:hypothetical protein